MDKKGLVKEAKRIIDDAAVKAILSANAERIKAINAPFDPVTGEGSTGKRTKVFIRDFPTPAMWLPDEMMQEPFLCALLKAKSLKNYMRLNAIEYLPENYDLVVEAFVRLRIRYDFPFWAYVFGRIKPKGGGEDIPFRLRPSQRKLVEQGFENLKVLHAPVRLVILKARQWGGSTCTQLFMVWLQTVHAIGLNSLVIAQDLTTATVIQEMFRNAISQYPARLLHPLGEDYSEGEVKWAGVGSVQNIHTVPQRKCKITVGTMVNPDSCRGGDYNLVHCSEVGVWKKTLGKEPEDVVDAATGGMGLDAMTMVVYESTAKGTGNFFHREWEAAKDGSSQFKGIFIPWYEISDRYWLDFDSEEEKARFAKDLYDNRFNENTLTDREEPGKYLWWLFSKGATLEGIHWYIEERKKFRDHAHMASEYPTDDIEAFTHSGTSVFDAYLVERFKPDCREPAFIGDVAAKGVRGRDALTNVRFEQDRRGLLWVWQLPETFPDERVMHRYLVVVDIGGRWRKADYSVIAVFDRYDMMEGGLPAIVAQWRGHIDHDLLAWKAAQVAAFYDNALLVVESNTLDKEKETDDGDQSGFILNQIKESYDNLYARSTRDEQAVMDGAETMYGFHTNTKTKPEIISHLIEVVREQLYVERDKQCLNEYLLYELADGKYQATPGPDHHDDILMTRAIGLWVCYREMPRPYFVKRTDMQYISFARMP